MKNIFRNTLTRL